MDLGETRLLVLNAPERPGSRRSQTSRRFRAFWRKIQRSDDTGFGLAKIDRVK